MMNDRVEEPKSPSGPSDSEAAPAPKKAAGARLLSLLICCGGGGSWRRKRVVPAHTSPSSPSPSSPSSPPPPETAAARVGGSNRDQLRPTALRVAEPAAPEEAWSRKEEADDTHVYYCPICMYYLTEMFKTKCCGHHLCQDCMRDISARHLTPGLSICAHTNTHLHIHHTHTSAHARIKSHVLDCVF